MCTTSCAPSTWRVIWFQLIGTLHFFNHFSHLIYHCSMTSQIHDLEPNCAKALAKQKKLKQSNQGIQELLTVQSIQSLIPLGIYKRHNGQRNFAPQQGNSNNPKQKYQGPPCTKCGKGQLDPLVLTTNEIFFQFSRPLSKLLLQECDH